MGPASQSNDWNVRREWSFHMSRHGALNRGTLKRQKRRNMIYITVESTFAWSEYVHFRRKRTAITTALCARGWFFGKKLALDSRSRGKFLARTLTKVRNDDSRRATLHRKRKSMEKNFGFTSTQRLVQFLMSSVIITYMESRFRSPLHLETTPKFGWSHPQAQTVTWMSCDTQIQKIFLKMLLTIVCKIKIKSISKFKGQVTAFLFVRKRLGGPSRQWIQLWIQVGNPSLRICQEIGKTWSFARRWDRWCNSLEILKSKAYNQIPKWWRKQFHWQR